MRSWTLPFLLRPAGRCLLSLGCDICSQSSGWWSLSLVWSTHGLWHNGSRAFSMRPGCTLMGRPQAALLGGWITSSCGPRQARGASSAPTGRPPWAALRAAGLLGDVCVLRLVFASAGSPGWTVCRCPWLRWWRIPVFEPREGTWSACGHSVGSSGGAGTQVLRSAPTRGGRWGSHLGREFQTSPTSHGADQDQENYLLTVALLRDIVLLNRVV